MDSDNGLKCSSDRCKNYLCSRCATDYFRCCRKEQQLPLCPIKECRKHFLRKDISDLDDAMVRLYDNTIFNYYLAQTESEVNRRINEMNILEKMQKEREEFIRDHFPIAIYRTALIALPKKIRDVKKFKEASATKTRNYSISCRRTGCIGALEVKEGVNVCTMCETEFCSECDRIISKNEHECKKEDLESMTALKSIIKCPKCKTPVEKSEGCNGMTCAACGENFDYQTGEPGDHGGHDPFLGRHELSFYDSVSDLIDKCSKPKLFTRLIQEIEECSPKYNQSTYDKRIEGVLLKYRQGDLEKKEAKAKVVKLFRDQYIDLERYRTYLGHLNEIETGLREGSLTSKILRGIWTQYYDEEDDV